MEAEEVFLCFSLFYCGFSGIKQNKFWFETTSSALFNIARNAYFLFFRLYLYRKF
jgi:hypothetical protein